MGEIFDIAFVLVFVLYVMPIGIALCEDEKESSVSFFLDCWSALWFAGLVDYIIVDQDALSLLGLDNTIAIMVITFTLIIAFLLHLLVLSGLRALFKKMFSKLAKKTQSSSINTTETSRT